MKSAILMSLAACLAAAYAAPQDYRTTPVPILKQINRHNDDGSYSFGYESADGSFKIETKYPNGEVVGKYGYVGDDGKVREVEYGASRRGFEPSGTGINVPPPTLTNDSPSAGELDYDDGQYREDPSIYDRPSGHRFSQVSPSSARFPTPSYSNYRFQSQPYQSQQYQPNNFRSVAPQYYQRPIQYQQPANQYTHSVFGYDPNLFRGHPANVDLVTGSYHLSYSG
ncbi:UNVERIFIED_CONTAM: hypothetical protein PYX00_003471 [Menopon gallinae]|uniref:Cuticular protein n=1 Tax=Menopon gallinae TaxID=328185 RepID=A0AAW2I1R5_9NEOP